ncbi:hypothetical protein DEO72_LG7g1976 [Vigna unguiculata]|uniref:Uncharacterized protein n=1 Tax=Vigna unguiculata TaxID=3917 RepID=A0A4D6MGZ9_VIGUN|nr:hypothetical protein DEO72_LG7g1976 [Vigna unguiculata]
MVQHHILTEIELMRMMYKIRRIPDMGWAPFSPFYILVAPGRGPVSLNIVEDRSRASLLVDALRKVRLIRPSKDRLSQGYINPPTLNPNCCG